jgi:hypothetical protein
MRTRIAAALLTLTAVLAPAAPAQAAPSHDPLTWSVTPSGPKGPDGRTALDYKLDPGATVTDRVAVTNHSRRPLVLRLYANDAFTTAAGGFDLRAGNAAPTDAGGWITLAQERITLPASSRAVVAFTVTVPADATPGDHAAGVVASLISGDDDGAGRQVSVDHRVGSRVHLRVAGALRPRLAISDVRIKHAASWHPLRLPRVTVDFTISNPGNVRLNGTAAARIEGPFGLGGRDAPAAAVPEILPGGSLRASMDLGAVPPLVRERLVLDIQPAPSDGRAIDPAPAPATSAHTVWLVPWSQLAGAALVALLIVFWLLGRRRRARRFRTAIAAAEKRGRDQKEKP